MPYAESTSVSVEKSRAELEHILNRYGASKFAYMTDDNQAIVCFVFNGKMVKFTLRLPERSDVKFTETPAYGNTRKPARAYLLWEQSCRQKWRALTLCIKAKLVACEDGITSFEKEFLAHFVMPDGHTIAEKILPQLDQAVKDGRMPTLLLSDSPYPLIT